MFSIIKSKVVTIDDYNKFKNTILLIKKEKNEKIKIIFKNLDTVILKTWFLKIINEHILTKTQLNRLLSKRIINNIEDVNL